MVRMEESKTMDGHHLSPDAVPYHPEFIDIAIYNEGKPSMSLVSEQDVYNVLHGINDECIMEVFPPDAVDAAELDEVDDFVETMATIAFMEEREELCREEFVHLKKRWAARRAEGLVGRPRPPKHMVDPVIHKVHAANPQNQDVRDVVRSLMVQDNSHKQRMRDMKRRDEMQPRVRNKMMMNQNRRANIQQPRKQN